jgi:glutathione synthase/RimK-type ligase-like ATP-grasp enzyme
MIAIHKGKGGFHPRWVEWCDTYKVPYKMVNCFDNDIINQLKGCKALLWHHSQNDPKALVSAKSILFALEQVGIKVFPDFNTNWHFDDKLGQKYLLEALDVPFVPTAVFYNKIDAMEWACKSVYPKVFKLRGGAGSSNVKLVRNHREAVNLIRKAFGRGFPNYDRWGNFKERIRKWRMGKIKFWDVAKGFARILVPPKFAVLAGHESGYIYFQDFIPNNDHDIRVIVIGDKAFAIKRMVRKNDFRASGSGTILYKKELFNEKDIQLAFEIHNKLKSQCTAMDFVYDNGQPKVVEISYGFDPNGYLNCPGFWDSDLKWYEGDFDPYGWMVDQVLENGK